MSEDALKAVVIELAELLGWRVYSVRRSDRALVQGRSGRGFPDLVLMRGGRVVFAELKSESGALTEAQRGWIHGLQDEHDVYVWRPRHWVSGAIERVLRGRGGGVGGVGKPGRGGNAPEGAMEV